MKNKVMQLVKQICDIKSTDCRSLNKDNLVRKLMNLANIPQNADIQEIPLDWDNQVVILFLLPHDKNYYSLFAGIGCDGKFYFEMSITGIFDGKYFHFLQEDGKEDQMLPIDYFVKKTTVTEQIRHFIETVAKLAISECPEMTMEQYIAEYTSQILENDYYSVVNWANWNGIAVPNELIWIIDPKF